MSEKRDALSRLQDVADDYERDTLEELAIRAGLLWRCPREPCQWNNREDDAQCGGCGLKRSDIAPCIMCGDPGVPEGGDDPLCARCAAGQDAEAAR